jgi:hypothetical protein
LKRLLTICLVMSIIAVLFCVIPTNISAQEPTPTPTETATPTESPTPTPTATPTPTPSPTPTAAPPKYEISGYILDKNGNGIGGAMIIFNVPNIVPSVYSDISGHYVIYAPAGIYRINVWPPFDSNYLSYDEPGFTVSSDIAKNITLNTGYKVSGYIRDSSGKPVVGAVVVFDNYCSGYFSNSQGYYFLSVPAAGTYTINAHPRTGSYSGTTTDFPPYLEYNFAVSGTTTKNIIVNSTSTPTPTPTPENLVLFKIETNSTTWSDLNFNSTSVTLTFNVSGENGTIGYTKVSISKTLVPTFTGATVSLDGKSTNFTISASADYWIFEFTYHHSTHDVAIDMGSDFQVVNELPVVSHHPVSNIPEFTPFALVVGIIIASVALAFARKKLNPMHTAIVN